jgi:hypothetical protein
LGTDYLIVIASTLLLCACEQAMQAKVEGGSPVVFTIWSKHYSYFIASENGMPARADFEIRDGNAVVAKIQRPCSYFESNGNEIEIPCDDKR